MPMPPNDGDEDDVLDQIDDQDDGSGSDGAEGTGGEPEGNGDDTEGSPEHVDDAEAGGEHEVDEPPARRPSRGESRVQRLANESRAARERADALEREVRELRRAQNPPPQQETPEARRTRLSLMTPEERSEFLLNESNERHSRDIAMTRFMVQDQMDLQNFNSTLRDNPKLSRYKGEVDRIFKEQQERGMFVSRDVILDTVIGRAARASQNRRPANEDSRRRVDAQRVSGRSPRGAAPAARQRAGTSAESRLKDVEI